MEMPHGYYCNKKLLWYLTKKGDISLDISMFVFRFHKKNLHVRSLGDRKNEIIAYFSKAGCNSFLSDVFLTVQYISLPFIDTRCAATSFIYKNIVFHLIK